MAQLTAEQIGLLIDECRAHLGELAETLRATLGCDVRLTAADSHPYSADLVASEFDGPGLALSLGFGEQGILFLVPEKLPLPSWYRDNGISENNRLQTIAYELSLQLMPGDLQVDRYAAVVAANLKELTQASQVNPSALALEISVFEAGAAEGAGAAPTAKILAIAPVDAPQLTPKTAETPGQSATEESQPRAQTEAASSKSEPTPVASGSSQTVPCGQASGEAGSRAGDRGGATAYDSTSTAIQHATDQSLREQRILNVPVTVSVRLAERKMPLGQVIALAPGALIQFSKSCEDLLDLFVNNHLYCQGEAIKIGEHFGIKVAKVDVTEERKEHVF